MEAGSRVEAQAGTVASSAGICVEDACSACTVYRQQSASKIPVENDVQCCAVERASSGDVLSPELDEAQDVQGFNSCARFDSAQTIAMVLYLLHHIRLPLR